MNARTLLICLSALVLAAQCQTDRKPKPPAPPPAPTMPPMPDAAPPEPDAGQDMTLTEACLSACDRWEAWNCKEGRKVCATFDEEGECREWDDCFTACTEDPQAYPDPYCVASLGALADDCESARTNCEQD